MDANKLFEDAMRGRWKEVSETYKKYPEAQRAKITKAGDTVLHMAVSDGKTDVVLQMVAASGVLNMRNDRGNTPLHLAAELGDVHMCQSMASKDKHLIAARNLENETPLFSAALHGKKTAFLCIQSFLTSLDHDYYSLCRKKCGDTILHAAISGEYFELAFQIIHCYPDLVNAVNENGQSPLHILAAKPNVFRSSDHIVLFDSLVYKCIPVDPLKEEKFNPQVCAQKCNPKPPKYPENYGTCISFFHILGLLFQVLTMGKRNGDTETADQENPQTRSSSSQGQGKYHYHSPGSYGRGDLSEVKRNPVKEEKGDHFYPPNYATFCLFFELAMKALLVVLGLGISRIQKIKEKKRNHRWANQVMHELVNDFQRSSSASSRGHGSRPCH